MQTQTNLVRKQYLISESNIRKIEMLASAKGASAAEIVRRAIDAYDPHGAADMEAPELMQVVHERPQRRHYRYSQSQTPTDPDPGYA